jgi:hypothetical protein
MNDFINIELQITVYPSATHKRSKNKLNCHKILKERFKIV